MHHFPSTYTEYIQAPVGRRTNLEAHRLVPRRPSVRAV